MFEASNRNQLTSHSFDSDISESATAMAKRSWMQELFNNKNDEANNISPPQLVQATDASPKEQVRGATSDGQDSKFRSTWTVHEGAVLRALDGLQYIAEAGSTVYASKGADIIAKPGSTIYVDADGCSVNAKDGPTIHQEPAANGKDKASIIVLKGKVLDAYDKSVIESNGGVINAHSDTVVWARSGTEPEFGPVLHSRSVRHPKFKPEEPDPAKRYEEVREEYYSVIEQIGIKSWGSTINAKGNCTVYMMNGCRVNPGKDANVDLYTWDGTSRKR